ncbi:glycosyltransferase family 2 protein [Marinovum algicola]|uniref:glycosyltransferase family 2 protein n=1 Tax=Marinovum algicola TaxID=42444 RepID=UPI0024B8F514|nr:glycosyltransferase family 2 protein [Marinovum algicola]
MSQARLLCILLNYRTAELCRRAARTAVTALQGLDAELLIVDNDSGDGSFEQLTAFVAAEGWPQVRVISAGRNGGFGAGNNHGMRAGRDDGQPADYIYILNPDAFPEPGAIRVLADWLDSHPETGIAGSLIRNEAGAQEYTAFRFPSIAGEFEHSVRFGPVSRLLHKARVPIDLPDRPQPVDWLAGASMMLRREMLDRIGLFDETFFLYFEETDLCLRAARDGWQTVYLPESRVTHIGSVSTGMKRWDRVPRYWLDSRLYYFTKSHGAAYAALATLTHATGGLMWRLRKVLQRKPDADPPHFLRDLVAHHVRALLSRSERRATPQPARRLP